MKVKVQCPECEGAGVIGDIEWICETCKGKGFIMKDTGPSSSEGV